MDWQTASSLPEERDMKKEILVFSGGTGTPKLLRGLRKVQDESLITVVVNTAEDVWVSGNLVCPDIDSVLYALSDRVDLDRWWGQTDDTFVSHDCLSAMGHDEGMMIGDKDRATHIARTALLRNGQTLTQSVDWLAKSFDIKIKVLPMTEDNVQTYLETSQGPVHFQTYWVTHKGDLRISAVEYRGLKKARPTKEFLEVLERVDTVLIGPSNPVTSIYPIIGLRGVKEALSEKSVIAVSPIIGDTPVSGPAAALLKVLGYEVTSQGITDFYEGFLDVLIQDYRDPLEVKGVKTIRADTIIKDREVSIDLANLILETFKTEDKTVLSDDRG